MGHLHRRGHTGNDHHLMTPIKLVGLAGHTHQWHVASARRHLQALPTAAHAAEPDLLPQQTKLLVHPQEGQAVALAPLGVLRQHSVELVGERSQLRARLLLALAAPPGPIAANDALHRVPRQPKLPRDLLDGLALDVKGLSNQAGRLHCDQPLDAQLAIRLAGMWRPRGCGRDCTPITPS